MICSECVYCWKDEHEEYARCHWEPVCWEQAPCDEEEHHEAPYEVHYNGAYFKDDNEGWNVLEFDTQESAMAKYDGLIGVGFPINDVYIKNTEYECYYQNGEWEV